MLKRSIQYPDIAQLENPVEMDSSIQIGNNSANWLNIE
jgi:hypothetical protein